MDTKAGQDAKKYVEAKLKEVEFVVVKTHKSDKYDRYLTDIFYLKDEDNPLAVLEEGTFLNQELLDISILPNQELYMGLHYDCWVFIYTKDTKLCTGCKGILPDLKTHEGRNEAYKDHDTCWIELRIAHIDCSKEQQ